jgi:uncharacterized membrane protein
MSRAVATPSVDGNRTATVHWWLLAAAVISCPLLFATVWALIAQFLVLGIAIYRLAQRPAKKEAVVLWITMGLILLSLLAVTVSAVAAFNLSTTFTGTSVPVD